MNNIFYKSVLILLLIVSSIIISCNKNSYRASNDEFLIKAIFSNSKGEILYLYELNVHDKTLLDSAKINEDGQFVIKHKINEPGFYLLYQNKNNFITLLANKGETIEITADLQQLARTYNVKGSPGSSLIHEFEAFTRENNKKVEKLSLAYEKLKNSPQILEIQDSLNNEFKIILEDQKKKVKSFITKNNNSLASLIAINRRFREHTVVSEKDDFIYFDLLDRTLSAIYPNNKHTIEHHKRVNAIKLEQEEARLAKERLAPGKKAPHYELPSIEGKIINSENLKGKIVILYFWASWNALSRQLNPKLVNIYKKYKNKGLEIVGISLDNVNDIWRAAIKLDKLEWIQLNDFLGWDSPVIKDYYVKKLPHLCLIDAEGNIIENNTNIDEIQNKIYLYLKN
ncbi:MAG TPA: TlpA disulfide reductase family protein [Bacteroidales bacterium]|nr:TlpA disulfide reductase family protein [Bacteroidales bacterium]